jgi:SMODS-associating 4TM effector domain
MNDIPTRQNEKYQLQLLAAQRQTYSDAKKILVWQLALVVIAGVCLSLLPLYIPEAWPCVAIGITLIVFLDIFILEPQQRDKAQIAAKVQEDFDCRVLDLHWQEIKMDAPPNPEEVVFQAKKYGENDPTYDALKNWYPKNVGQLPLPVARIVCQRSNIWWDCDLRSRYNKYILVFIVIMFLIVLLISCAFGLAVPAIFLSILFPLLPAIQWSIREFKKQKESVDNLRRLLRASTSVFEKSCKKMISDEQSTVVSRALQNEIYDHRRTSPLLFDWIYKRLRDEMEGHMKTISDRMIEDWKGGGK